MIKKREKAQKWRLISINSLALAVPHWQAQHIQPQHGPGASSSGAFQERPVAQSQLGWERTWWCAQAQEAAVQWACCPQGSWVILQGPAVERKSPQGPARGQVLFRES